MAEDTQSGPDADTSGQPPVTFIEELAVPTAMLQTAIGITHDNRMTKVAVKFHLAGMDNRIARYAASCPRCHDGVLEAFVAIDPGGGFVEHPACPALCEACEDQLDAILEGRASSKRSYVAENRVTLKKFTPRLKRS